MKLLPHLGTSVEFQGGAVNGTQVLGAQSYSPGGLRFPGLLPLFEAR
jgi:hypothetical protein